MFYWGLGAGACHRFIDGGGIFLSGVSQLNMDKTTLLLPMGCRAGFVNGSRVLYSDFAEDVPGQTVL